MQNIYFIDLTTILKCLAEKDTLSSTPQKLKIQLVLRKLKKRDRQFLVDKVIHTVEFKNTYENSTDKKAEIIDTEENNYRTIRRVYQQPLC